MFGKENMLNFYLQHSTTMQKPTKKAKKEKMVEEWKERIIS